MERLTERDDKGNLLFNGKQVYAGDFYEAVSCLEEYEDTGLDPEQIKGKAEALKIYQEQGLTPDQIMELKERDTAKAPEEIQDAFGDGRLICPNCRNSVINYFNRSRPPQFCMICGQRLKFGE